MQWSYSELRHRLTEAGLWPEGRGDMSARGSADQLAASISKLIKKQVIIEATGGPKQIAWHINPKAEGSGEIQEIMKRLQEQTGMTFKEETRKVKHLVIESSAMP